MAKNLRQLRKSHSAVVSRLEGELRLAFQLVDLQQCVAAVGRVTCKATQLRLRAEAEAAAKGYRKL